MYRKGTIPVPVFSIDIYTWGELCTDETCECDLTPWPYQMYRKGTIPVFSIDICTCSELCTDDICDRTPCSLPFVPEKELKVPVPDSVQPTQGACKVLYPFSFSSKICLVGKLCTDDIFDFTHCTVPIPTVMYRKGFVPLSVTVTSVQLVNCAQMPSLT